MDARSVPAVGGRAFSSVSFPCAVAVLMTAAYGSWRAARVWFRASWSSVGVHAFSASLRHAWRGVPSGGQSRSYLFGLVCTCFMLGALWAFLPDLVRTISARSCPSCWFFLSRSQCCALGRLMITRHRRGPADSSPRRQQGTPYQPSSRTPFPMLVYDSRRRAYRRRQILRR